MRATLVLLTFLVFAAGLLPACGGEKGTSVGDARNAAAERARERQLVRLERQIHKLKRERRRESRRREAARARKDVAPDNSNSSLEEFVSSVEGEVGVTLGAPGTQPALSGGSLSGGSAWSTIKVPILLRVLSDAGGPEGLTSTQRQLAESAITVSDNEAAAALFEGLELSHGGLEGASAAVTAVLREGGDTSTVVSTVGRDGFSTYGQTEWSLADQYRFIASLAAGCVGTRESSDYTLSLMGAVTDTWGFGALGLPARWKGGWGPGVDGRYLVRQMGEVEVDGRPVVATIAAIASDGQFESAQAIATEAARWVAEHAELAGSPVAC